MTSGGERARGSREKAPHGTKQAVYAMSVAAELTGVNPPMLRAYEAKGLISPHRTEGGTRRYSADDLAEVNHITELLDSGLNLAGVEAVLSLEKAVLALRAEVAQLRDRLQLGETEA